MAEAHTDSHKHPLILIVDDEPELMRLYTYALKNAGIEVISAENGLKGIAAANGPRRPDLILMDVKMPVMDGAKAFTKLKDDPATKDIKIVFMTAFGDPQVPEIDEKFAKEVGAVEFVGKDIDIEEFVEKVKKALA